MSDYSQITDFSVKDGLTTGNPAKLIKGSEFDAEFAAIQAAIGTKYDSNDLSDQGTAEAGTSNTVLMTPLRTQQWGEAWAAENAGAVLDIHDLSVPAGDRILFYDTSSSITRYLTASAADGITIDTTNLKLTTTSATNVTPATSDEFLIGDASDSYNIKAVTFGALEGALTIANQSDASTRGVDHSAVSITAGTGLSGGGTIASTRTINLDISGLTSMTAAPVGTDSFLYNDGGTMKQMTYNQVALPSRNVSSSGNFASTDVGEIVYWTGTSGTLTMPTGVGQDDCFIIVINSGSGTLSIAGSGVTITSANSLTDIPAGGIACLFRESSTVWFLGGSLE